MLHRSRRRDPAAAGSLAARDRAECRAAGTGVARPASWRRHAAARHAHAAVHSSATTSTPHSIAWRPCSPDGRTSAPTVTGAGEGAKLCLDGDRAHACPDRAPSPSDGRSCRPFERPDGTASAFVDGDARAGDVVWVAGFRRSVEPRSFHAAHHPGTCSDAAACRATDFRCDDDCGVPSGEVLHVPARAQKWASSNTESGAKPVAASPEPVLASPMARRRTILAFLLVALAPAWRSGADAGRVPPVASRKPRIISCRSR